MFGGKPREDDEEEHPDSDEKEEDEESDSPGWRVLCRPEVAPVAAVGGREPVVLKDDGDEEPYDNFPPEDGVVEGGDFAGCLAIVGWEAEEEGNADEPHENREGKRNVGYDVVGDYGGGERDAGATENYKCAAPVPEG